MEKSMQSCDVILFLEANIYLQLYMNTDLFIPMRINAEILKSPVNSVHQLSKREEILNSKYEFIVLGLYLKNGMKYI